MLNKTSTDFSSGYFGKLTEFNDFIKFNAGSPEIFFVDSWLQAGMAYAKLNYKSEWKEKYDGLRPTGFFLPVPSSGKVVIGIMYPGKDRSGREFPFLIFSLLQGNYFSEYHLIPAELQPILTEFDRILRNEKEIHSLNNSIKNYTILLPSIESLQNKFNEYLSNAYVNEFSKRTKLNFASLKITDLMFTESNFIRFSFYSSNDYFGFDTGVLLSLLNKKITLSYRHSSIFWSQNDDGEFQITIFPFNITAVNFVDLLSICCDNRILNLFQKVSSPENNQTADNILLKQLFKFPEVNK